jgi:PGAP1-like protein
MAGHPQHPIIYVRGFAGTQGEVEETVADPYMGFNIGSAKCRQMWTGEIKRFFFESPMVRLFKEHEYDDVYVDGMDQVLDLAATEPIPYRSLIIYRYYEPASKQLGTGKLPEMEDYARGLSDLIVRLREKVCANKANKIKPANFRVYLVAHSMGGLICRAFLQNPKLGDDEARKAVDKVFTYGTPHNGIDFRLIGNVPEWFSFHNTNDFNRERMAEYLNLKAEYKAQKGDKDVSILKNFDPDRFFNMVGTNAGDYSAGRGLSRLLAGEASDGLVGIKNATTHGEWNGQEVSSPRAFVFRSHSGHYGIVNSEEGYQNLTRFLFGNVRVDGVLEIDELTLPEKVQKAKDSGKEIRASYHFEVVVSVRGKQWEMHRRTVNENSATFRKYDDLFDRETKKPIRENSPHLFSAFLDGTKRVNAKRPSLGFAVDLRVMVPDYVVNGFLFLDDHYEGGHIFRDRIYFEATPPPSAEEIWKVDYGFESETPNAATTAADVQRTGSGVAFIVPIERKTRPGIRARLRVAARKWQ